ncbi:rhodanese-related sulfurtransferase [Candidatus Woesearchaeota archaeon]|nr:rhodanese-related sulfurtransferase [Candidatus Woesearchaeota archaeon]
MEKITTSSFYKYIELENPEEFQENLLEYCIKLELKGKVLVAKEGINGTVSGNQKQIEEFEKHLLSFKDFKDIMFKRTETESHPYRKTHVRLRNEIVTSKFGIKTEKVGKHLTPENLKELYDKKDDFIILDARNNYEAKIGKFKNAVTSPIKYFRDFPKTIKDLEKYKNKKIVMYCTAGVRCEKASALLIANGFEDVNQLQGGIVNFINKFPDTYFEGRCFMFDDRISIATGSNTKDIAICEKCHNPSGNYINCKNAKCNKLMIMCEGCNEEWKDTCSKFCRNLSNN